MLENMGFYLVYGDRVEGQHLEFDLYSFQKRIWSMYFVSIHANQNNGEGRKNLEIRFNHCIVKVLYYEPSWV
jgi:hypothetical protein